MTVRRRFPATAPPPPPLSREPRGAEGARAPLEGQTEGLGLCSAATRERHLGDQPMNADLEATWIYADRERSAEVLPRQRREAMSVEDVNDLGNLDAANPGVERARSATRRSEQLSPARRDACAKDDLA